MSNTEPPPVLIFGDSNVWGHDPESGSRLPRGVRWPGVLQSLNPSIHVIEEGLNGRTNASDDPQCTWLPPNPCGGDALNGRKHIFPILHSAKPVKIVIVALGVNDLKNRFNLTTREIAINAGLLIDDIRMSGVEGNESGWEGDLVPKVLLICPPPITNENFYVDFQGGGKKRSNQLKTDYQRIAEEKSCDFLDAGEVPNCKCSIKDGIHLDADSHRALAQAVNDKINEMTA